MIIERITRTHMIVRHCALVCLQLLQIDIPVQFLALANKSAAHRVLGVIAD